MQQIQYIALTRFWETKILGFTTAVEICRIIAPVTLLDTQDYNALYQVGDLLLYLKKTASVAILKPTDIQIDIMTILGPSTIQLADFNKRNHWLDNPDITYQLEPYKPRMYSL